MEANCEIDDVEGHSDSTPTFAGFKSGQRFFALMRGQPFLTAKAHSVGKGAFARCDRFALELGKPISDRQH